MARTDELEGVEAEALRRLARLDSCALSDALDRLSLPGCVTGLLAATVPARVTGRVHTVKLAAGPASGSREHSGPAARHLATTAIEACTRGDIIVIEQRTGIDAACWGGILSCGARLRGIAGVIADGPVRDIDEARELGFPVYCRSITARTARGRLHEQGTDVPVQVADVSVHPGDYVLADASAVVFVRSQRLAEVLATAEAIAAREAAMLERLREGRSIAEVMGADYERMLQKD
ncbi:MAG TPA: RraA family protein [Steroidobacteraceae bacterium]|nr:RraA family protein [Steroidobacteraceae bacterium]